MAQKHSRKALTVEFKRKVIQFVEENPKKKKLEIAKNFDITPSTLTTIIKNKEKYGVDGGLSKICKKAKKGELQDVEEAVIKWLQQCRNKNVAIGGPILQEKAQQFAEELGHADFRASNGWLDRFKKRHEISFKKICGESAAVSDVTCEDWKAKLPDLTRGYNADDIYNADETGLFFKCLPDKTLTFKEDPCHGGKNSKERLTVLLCTNSSGTDKLKPLVIGKSKKPRCFKNVSTLPTDYRCNNKAWMNREVFDDWLKQTNKAMKKKKKHILLFIDNCTAHGNTIPTLTNIKVQFLPPNTTSILQPLDQGIIQSFKSKYRREVVRQFLNDLECQSPTKISVLDAMWMVTKAWNNVNDKTIANCFKKSGIQVNELDQNQDEDDLEVQQPEPIEGCWPRVREALNMDLDFEEFVNFDDDVAICGELTDAEIVSSVAGEQETVEEAEDDVDEELVSHQPDFTSKDARNALNVLKCYFLKKSALKDGVVKSITVLDCEMDNLTQQGKQSKLTDFFSGIQGTE